MGSCTTCTIQQQTQLDTIISSQQLKLRHAVEYQLKLSSSSNEDQFIEQEILDEFRLDQKINQTIQFSLCQKQFQKQKRETDNLGKSDELPKLGELCKLGEVVEQCELGELIENDLPSISERRNKKQSKFKKRVELSTDFNNPSQTSPQIIYSKILNKEFASPLNQSSGSIKSILKQKSQRTIQSQTSSKKVQFAQQSKYIHMIAPLSKNRQN